MPSTPAPSAEFDLTDLLVDPMSVLDRPNWHQLVDDKGRNALIALIDNGSPGQVCQLVEKAIAEKVLPELITQEDPLGATLLAHILVWWTGDDSVNRGQWTHLLTQHQPPALNRAGHGLLWQCRALATSWGEADSWLADHPILEPDQVRYLSLNDWLAGFKEDDRSAWLTRHLVKVVEVFPEHEMVYFLMGACQQPPQGETRALWPVDLRHVWNFMHLHAVVLEAHHEDRSRFLSAGGFTLPEALLPDILEGMDYFKQIDPQEHILRRVLNHGVKEARWEALQAQAAAVALTESALMGPLTPSARRSL